MDAACPNPGSRLTRTRTTALGTGLLLALLASSAALAASTIELQASTTVNIAAGRTETVTVGYPDALEYGNATYAGRTVVLGPPAGARGATPSRGAVKVLSAGSVLGGSAYKVRIHNANRSGTAPLRVAVTAITREPLPHS
ncbi:MAG: hypothetical protein ABSC56_11220 [Solirubrobacteraceae bacterium]